MCLILLFKQLYNDRMKAYLAKYLANNTNYLCIINIIEQKSK